MYNNIYILRIFVHSYIINIIYLFIIKVSQNMIQAKMVAANDNKQKL